MPNLEFAIVGCGAIARKHLLSIAACPGARLAALCDVNEERMEQLAALWQQETGDRGDILRYTDIHELLSVSSISVIVVAVHSGLHAQIARCALQANKHVVLEKPAVLSLRDADEIAKLADEKQRIVQVCHQLRYRPLLRKIKKTIDEGLLGEIRLGSVKLRLNRSEDYYRAAAWRGTWEQDGGMLLNQGIHAVDLLMWYLGSPRSVQGDLTFVRPFKETEDIALGTVAFSNGTKGMIEANSMTLPSNLEQSLFLLGDKGAISIGGESMERIDRWYIQGREHALDEAQQLMTDHNEHRYMYQALMDALQGSRSADLVDLSESRGALELIFALYSSAATARTQRLPLTDFDLSQLRFKKGQRPTDQ